MSATQKWQQLCQQMVHTTQYTDGTNNNVRGKEGTLAALAVHWAVLDEIRDNYISLSRISLESDANDECVVEKDAFVHFFTLTATVSKCVLGMD